jgi:hypothetical protein
MLDDDYYSFDTTVDAAPGLDDVAGVLWEAPRDTVTAVGIVFKFFSDGGWFDDSSSPFSVEWTANGGTTWFPVTGLQKGRYTTDYPALEALPWDVEAGYLLTFDPVHGIDGIRVRGDGGGFANSDGFIGVVELEAFAPSAGCLDLVRPTVTLLQAPSDGAWVNAYPTLTWTGADVAPSGPLQYSYRINGGSFTTWAPDSLLDLTGSGEGDYVFELRARDVAGNVSETVTRSFHVDVTPPTAVATWASFPASPTVTLTWSGSDNLTPGGQVEFRYRLDSGPWSSFSTATRSCWRTSLPAATRDRCNPGTWPET